MADMITAEALRARQNQLGDVTTVAYVNTSADVKAESDICCTSANAVKVVSSLPPDRRILFVPDRHLAAYVARETGRPLLDSRLPILDPRLSPAEIIPWEGFCYVHASFVAADVVRARQEHPGAFVVVHPESPLEVIDAADAAASTSGMVRLAREHSEIVLGTEAGMCDRIRRDLPQVRCWPLRRTALCQNMKLTRLVDVRAALEDAVPEITIPETIAVRARRALDRMMEVPSP
jgi:quinolinate synthase